MMKTGILSRVDFLLKVGAGLFFFALSFLAFSAPVIQSLWGYPHGESLYSLLSPICHQYPTRSLWVFDRPFALCTRCFSGYLGVVGGLYILQFQRRYLKRLFYGLVLLLPGVLDGYIQLISEYESTNVLRAVTGFAGGVGILFIIYPLTLKKENCDEMV